MVFRPARNQRFIRLLWRGALSFACIFHGDWGDVCAEDKETNDLALVEGMRG